jgi:hypothetical protein
MPTWATTAPVSTVPCRQPAGDFAPLVGISKRTRYVQHRKSHEHSRARLERGSRPAGSGSQNALAGPDAARVVAKRMGAD